MAEGSSRRREYGYKRGDSRRGDLRRSDSSNSNSTKPGEPKKKELVDPSLKFQIAVLRAMAKRNPWGDAPRDASTEVESKEGAAVVSVATDSIEVNSETKVKIPLKMVPEFARQEQANGSQSPMSCFKINEIAELSGIKDERETQRYLYILEGHKLVTPLPPGDLTSKNWQITGAGLKTVEQLVQSRVAANA